MNKGLCCAQAVAWPFLLLPILIAGTLPQSASPVRIIEDFSDAEAGEFPRDFRTYPFQRKKAQKVYAIQKEGENLFLSASDREEISVQVFRKFYWPTDRYPTFSWRWRVRDLPRSADERNPNLNDIACGVYVVFGGYGGRVLKYVWSSTLPEGLIIPKKEDKFFMFIKAHGPSEGWRPVSVNIVQDYRQVFNEDPKKMPIGFGILTDGNATHSPASCDYDDFVVSKGL